MRSIPPSLVAAVSLIVGFGVAVLTDVRPIGGLVLFAGGLYCGLSWRERRGLPVALALITLFLALFVASHVLGDLIGAWPSVFTVAAIMGAAGWWFGDRRPT